MSKRAVLGISAFYHDSAAALLVDGKVVAAAQEERFTRKKYDSDFPVRAIEYVLAEARLSLRDVEQVVYFEKPFIKFERLLETFHAVAPRGFVSFLTSMPVWVQEKLFMEKQIRKGLAKLDSVIPPIAYSEHHLSHAASAFFASPFEEAAVLTLDGVGEWATTSICHGKGNQLSMLYQQNFPHSLGLLYSAFTYYCGFKVLSGEYKLMGLAPYGRGESAQVKEWKKKIYEHLVDVRDDGSFVLNLEYFDFLTDMRMCNDKKWQELFGIPRRIPETLITEPYMDLAIAIQQVTEEILLKIARTVKNLTGCKYLTMAGGVALNCVANGKLLRSGLFEDIWIQPAAGDSGGALGAAYVGWHMLMQQPRQAASQIASDSMCGSYLGPDFSEFEIQKVHRRLPAVHQRIESEAELCSMIASDLANGKIVGWFQGRMEYGPRALGNRSILGDPRNPEMQKKLNLSIKYRESFRPFAPSVLEEDITELFEIDRASPYMLLVADIAQKLRKELPAEYSEMSLSDRLYFLRSELPAITHVDFSARLQSVSKTTNPRYWRLISEFKKRTGIGVIVNTSFNVRGEPIVCTPEDALRCFLSTEMDILVVENFVYRKSDQSVEFLNQFERGSKGLD